MTHDWLETSGGFDVCARRGCYWQRRPAGANTEYRSARTDWRPLSEPACAGREAPGPKPLRETLSQD